MTTAADADLWTEMRKYFEAWGNDQGLLGKRACRKVGKLTDRHEKENRRADEDTKAAYKHRDTPEYRAGYISQLDSVYGPTIDGKVVMNKMGVTILQFVQVKQYLRCWKTRSGARARAENADIEGHAATCRCAQKSEPKYSAQRLL